MNSNVRLQKILISLGIIVTSSTALSAPGILQDIPLNISTSIQPNILFLLDDSGSMDWEQLISQAAQDVYSAGPNGRASDLIFSPTSNTHVNELCSTYNLMAYDPTIVYEPWAGEDSAGNQYDNKTLTTALDNPYISISPQNISNHMYFSWVDDGDGVFEVGECGTYSSVAAVSSTPGGFAVYTMGTNTSSADAAGYVVDSGGTGGNYGNNQTHGFVIQPAGATNITLTFSSFNLESGYDFLRVYEGTSTSGTLLATLDGSALPNSITVNSGSIYLRFSSDSSVVRSGFIVFWNHSASGVSTPSLGSVDTDLCRTNAHCQLVGDLPVDSVANSQQNYANWYTYYRKREYVAKKALSDIINDSTDRLGLATLHNNGGGGTLIKNMQLTSNKENLFENLFKVYSSSGTPLRQNLQQAGDYFKEGTSVSTGLFGFTPNHSGDGTVSSDSPIFNAANGGICQQNFTVVFSDGFWNGGSPSSIGDQDSDNASNAYDGGWFADTYMGGNPSSLSDTLADVAMKYLKNDLSSTLPNNANIVDVRDSSDPAQRINHQHLTTYTVAFGLSGNVDVNPNQTGFPGWTNPLDSEDLDRIDDMRHAAWNGRGEFLSAGNPQELINTLNEAINDISDRLGTATAASFSSGLIETDTLVFQSRFNTEDWSGDLLAFKFDENGVVNTNTSTDYTTTDGDGNTVTVAVIDEDDAIWSASAKLANRILVNGYADRSVVSYDGSDGVVFEFDNLSSAMQADLLTNRPASMSTSDYGNAIVNYLKGDSSNEVDSGLGLFRKRNNEYLNALIHSSPQYMGPPNDKYPNLIEGATNKYSTFVSAKSGRTPLVFVGGNDGMLHAFNASTVDADSGEEVFAYIPGMLAHNLHSLAELDYSHLAYVDATPTIRDVFIGGQWRTYLVGGLRSGGKGIYVLDVTDPAVLSNTANAASIVVNEFTDDNLGYTYSRPQIARMNNGRWAAVFGNGYNSSPTGDGKAKLFILFLDNGDVTILDTGAGDVVVDAITGDSDCNDIDSDCNGLSSPAIADINGDFITDRIYAGDLHGNMWVFNVSDVDASQWHVAFGGKPLLQACSSAPCTSVTRQPITTKPTLVRNPSKRSASTSPNILVSFGTGQYIAYGDDLTSDVQSFYTVWDAGSSTLNSMYGDLDRSKLTEQLFTYSGTDIGVTGYPVSYQEGSNYGWFIDLKVPTTNVFSKGRVVINPIFVNGFLVFAVTVPGGEVCNREGDSYLVVLGGLDGRASNTVAVVSESDIPIVGIELITYGNTVSIGTTDSEGGIGLKDTPSDSAIAQGRKSWSIIK